MDTVPPAVETAAAFVFGLLFGSFANVLIHRLPRRESILAPGNVATPMNAGLRRPGNEAYVNLMRTLTPTGRDFLSVDEMTGAAVFRASEDSVAMHGATVMVDGGWSAW